MKLILIDNNPDFVANFKKYVSEWENEKMKPNEDYYSMYKRVFEDYPQFMAHLVSLRDYQRLGEGRPYVRFYWFFDNDDNIVGTIRYRTNVPEYLGEVGFEISPQQRNKGYGRKMLKALINELNKEGIDDLRLTLHPDNLASQRIIELNGGEFLEVIRDEEQKVDLNLYEIISD